MILDIQFTENNQLFNTTFGEVHNISDGGYERGYEKGYEEGFDDGFDDAYREEQEKSVDITENCTKEVTPDDEMVLSKVIVNVDVPDKSKELENLIDKSGVLESTDGTATEKVEQLIEKAEDENTWYSYSEVTTSMSKWTNIQVERLPRMSLKNVTSLSYSFSEMPNLKSVDFYLNTEKATTLSSAFQKCQSLKYIKGINTAKALTVHDIFANCTVLETIEEPLDFSSITSAGIKPFNNCNALKNIRFVPETIKKSITIPSPVLSNESIQSIIDGLATVTTAQKLTLHTNAVLKILANDEWMTQISNKNWSVT